MSGKIEVTVAPTTFELSAGDTVEATTTIRNLGQSVDQLTLSVDGLDPSWYILPVSSVALFPNDQDNLKIILHPPKTPETKGGSYPFHISVVSQENPDEKFIVDVTLEIQALPEVDLSISPPNTSGRKGTYQIVANNPGDRETTLHLTASDVQRKLQFHLHPESLTVPGGSRSEATLDVQLNWLTFLFSGGKDFGFQVSATLPEAMEARTISGQLVHIPWYKTLPAGQGTTTALRSSIPYVASVTNFEAARGGTAPETLESAKLRAPQVLRVRTRAVTAEDFEYLALEASSLVARARCVSVGANGDGQSPPPGVVRLLLVPRVSESDRLIPIEELKLPRGIREEVQSYLDQRRLLATRLEITSPEYLPVIVEARIRVKAGADPAQLATDVERRLYRYINPVCGGSDGNGWPFGRSLTLSEIYAQIQGVASVDYIEEVKLFPVKNGERQEATTRISIPPHSLLCSHQHEIILE